MQKKIRQAITFTLIAFTIASCGKTTRKKIVNEWTVKSYTQTVTGTDTSFILNFQDSPKTPTKMTIKKDGTWEWVRSSSSSALIYGGSIYASTEETEKRSGTWSFVGKTKGDDFKKNERVIFNVLSENNRADYEGSPATTPMFQDTTITSSHTYFTGEKFIIYTVEKSTKDELHLGLDKEQVNSSQGVVSTEKIRLILVSK